MRRSEITRERAGGMLTTSPRLLRRLPQLTPPQVMSLQPLTTDPVLLSRTTSRRASQSEDHGGRIWKHLKIIWRRRKQRNQRQLWLLLTQPMPALCKEQRQRPPPHHGGTSLKSSVTTVTLLRHPLLRPQLQQRKKRINPLQSHHQLLKLL